MRIRVIPTLRSAGLPLAALRFAVLVCILLSAKQPLTAADDGIPWGPLSSALDFATTLEDIHHMLDDDDFSSLPTDRAVILDGVAVDIAVIDPEPESYLVQVDLASGRWLGLSEVRLYRAYVFFQGPDFAVRFHSGGGPETSGADGLSAEGLTADGLTAERGRRLPLRSGSRVIVLGLLVDLYEDATGVVTPIFEGIDIRAID